MHLQLNFLDKKGSEKGTMFRKSIPANDKQVTRVVGKQAYSVLRLG